jgi:hypothetical protein|tara:strand:+ start:196 stop:390 length:195 start_codon:yes stop_codon:yes gene_type:complete
MDIWDEVIQEFNKEINQLRITLGNGSAEDYPHYKQIVGSISGLEWARDNLTTIVKKRIYMEEEE